MQVAGGRRLRSLKSPHCSINKIKQRERTGKKIEIGWTNHWKKIKWLLWKGGCYLLLLVSC